MCTCIYWSVEDICKSNDILMHAARAHAMPLELHHHPTPPPASSPHLGAPGSIPVLYYVYQTLVVKHVIATIRAIFYCWNKHGNYRSH